MMQIKQYKRSIPAILLLMFLSSVTCSQETKSYIDHREGLLDYTEGVYGSDDMLVNGRMYVPLHSLAEGHPYYEIADWIIGDVWIRGNRYADQKLKYNIELDEFILYVEDEFKRKNYLVLNHHYVDSVALKKYLFVNTDVLPQMGTGIGYAELVFKSDNLFFFVKYKKTFKKEYSQSKPHGEYTTLNADRYINESGMLVKVNSKKAFLSYFETDRKEISKFMKQQRINYKKADSGPLNTLLNYCDALRNP